MKLPFTKQNRTSFLAMLGGINLDAAQQYLNGFKMGTEMELIIREKPQWDVDRMSRYFHGPVINAVKSWMRDDTGASYSKDDIKYYLKERFLGKDAFGVIKSLAELNFRQWIEFLKDINVWTIEKFGFSLPEDETEYGDIK